MLIQLGYVFNRLCTYGVLTGIPETTEQHKHQWGCSYLRLVAVSQCLFFAHLHQLYLSETVLTYTLTRPQCQTVHARLSNPWAAGHSAPLCGRSDCVCIDCQWGLPVSISCMAWVHVRTASGQYLAQCTLLGSRYKLHHVCNVIRWLECKVFCITCLQCHRLAAASYVAVSSSHRHRLFFQVMMRIKSPATLLPSLPFPCSQYLTKFYFYYVSWSLVHALDGGWQCSESHPTCITRLPRQTDAHHNFNYCMVRL